MNATDHHNQILVADSSAFYLRNITMLLQREGYEVVLAKDGRELLALSSARMPDLIMMDRHLPDLACQALCQALRANAPTAKTPIIVTTSESDNTNPETLGHGVRFLTKPIQTNTLISTIIELLFPSPSLSQEIKLFSQDRSLFWKTQVLRQNSGQRLVVRQEDWPANLAMAFQTGKRCFMEYVAADRALIEYSGSIGNDLPEGLEIKLDGPIKRVQQRQFFRKNVQLNVRYRFPGDFYRVTQTIDVSGGGAKLAEVPTALGLGEEFEMILILPEKKYTLNARIQWQKALGHDRQEVGVVFTDILPSDQEEIIMFLFGGAGKSPAI
ncbi:MAG: response regulator [Bacteroidota bacterium]